ncbi:ArsR/SmtB family transcription factor [Segnochrobactraceae bacterium EtOH-i3]
MDGRVDTLVAELKAAGEPTRLRLLALLSVGDLTVKDLTTILGQSQPRISRHLKLLTEAGLIDRFPEGAFAYYRLADRGEAADTLARALVARLDPSDPVLSADRARLENARRVHQEAAQRYFATNAESWDSIRALHAADERVERAMRSALGETPFRTLVDLGTGTGRILELFADLYQRGVGIDASAPMLSVARTNLARAGLAHAQVRQGDIYALGMPSGAADVVVLHQVLHFLDDPGRAVAEAARLLTPGGRLMIVDFAPHDLEFLRDAHQHRRLGFSRGQIAGWTGAAGLVMERIEDFPPDPGEQQKLTVTLWLARDPRVLMAAASDRTETA